MFTTLHHIEPHSVSHTRERFESDSSDFLKKHLQLHFTFIQQNGLCFNVLKIITYYKNKLLQKSKTELEASFTTLRPPNIFGHFNVQLLAL